MTNHKITMVSTDSHASAPPEVFREYIEARYLKDLDALVHENEEFRRMATLLADFPADVLDVIDDQAAIRSGGLQGTCDLDRRLVELDREGIVAELVIPGSQFAVEPFFWWNNRPHSPELRAAGRRAYHRWMADQIDRAGGRLIGYGTPGLCLDIDEMLAEVAWLAEHGFKAIAVPGTLADDVVHPLYHPFYEPFWAACADHRLVLVLHTVHGNSQGQNFDRKATMVGTMEELGKTRDEFMAMVASVDDMSDPFALNLVPRQVLWQLMLGGVFDRYPDLKLALTEVRFDWLPATLSHLDARFEQGDMPMRKRPSEYWEANCYAGASSIRPDEIGLRYEIGMDQLMFGRDYPHPEGTWPNTHDWIRATMSNLPEQEVRAILGENAIACYGLDRDSLGKIAERIGPRPEELLGDHVVAAEKIEHFHSRCGFNKGVPEFDAGSVDRLLDQDLDDFQVRH